MPVCAVDGGLPPSHRPGLLDHLRSARPCGPARAVWQGQRPLA